MPALPPEIQELMVAQVRDNPRRLVRVIDYLVVTTYDSGGPVPAGHEGPVELGSGVRLEKIGSDLAERLLDASSLRGENWEPTRVFHAVHAFVREAWVESDGEDALGNLYCWDQARMIWPAVQLSRLVRDNNISTEHAVRRLIKADGSERLVPFDGFESHVVYRLYPDTRGWLTSEEAMELRRLLSGFRAESALPDRVRRALRRTDSITRERYLEDALPLVVGAYESLVKIGRRDLTAQFSQRVAALAAEVGVSLTPQECAEVYDDRSALVHGAEVDLSQPHDVDVFGRRFNTLQQALRRIIRRAIEETEFAAVFGDDDAIASRWPAVVRRGGVEVSI